MNRARQARRKGLPATGYRLPARASRTARAAAATAGVAEGAQSAFAADPRSAGALAFGRKPGAGSRKPKGRAVAAGLLFLLTSCALPVVSAGTFLPAGDLKKGDVHVSISMEAGRVLAGPSDVDGLTAVGPQTQQWEVSTWVASDASVRYGLTDLVSLEAQVKLTNPITPFTPEVVGGAIGGRVRIYGHRAKDSGFAVELGVRAVGVFVDQTLERTKGVETQSDIWRYRALGLESPLIATWRLNQYVALTGSPFLRAYWIRATHSVVSSAGQSDTQRLDWTPVLSSGFGLSVALEIGPVEIAPGFAVELATRPGPGQPTTVLFEPGLSIGTKF